MKRGVSVSVNISVNASGAALAGLMGNVVMVVDVIDMSTTLEAAIDEGAVAVFGASPDKCNAPVNLDPHNIGKTSGKLAVKHGTEIIIVAEPRNELPKVRENRMKRVLAGINEAGAKVHALLPNTGAETVKLADFRNKVVVAVTDTGGVAFDAAFNAGAPEVITGTVARTIHKKGRKPAEDAALRAIDAAKKASSGITVVAASANSMEDILAAEYIYKIILENGFTNIF